MGSKYNPALIASPLVPKFSGIKRGTRLTPERFEKLRVGPGLTAGGRKKDQPAHEY